MAKEVFIGLVIMGLAFDAGKASFVSTRGGHFVQNGSPFFFNGFNSYWLMHVAVQPTERYKITNVMRKAAAAGLTVCRTWAFSDGGDEALQTSPGVYSEPTFQALDFVISEAEKNGIRLILTLSNNYHDFGGRPQYVNWARSAGVQVNNDDDFYTNPVIRSFYKNHVKTVLTRVNTLTGVAYKNEASIMAWELMNEPRCQSDYSGRTVNGWVKEMAAYLKSVDENHLLAVGMEGFYGDSISDRKQYNPGYQVGTDFITNHLVGDVDFATIHAYPDIWLSGKSDDEQMGFMRTWLRVHLSDSKTILKKPLVLAEFGKSKRDPGGSIDARDSFINTVYASVYDMAMEGTVGGGLVWQIVDEGMDQFWDGYEIVLSRDQSTIRVISDQSNKMIALAH